ncbi:MAG: hypothetical protein ABIJ09_14725 [Pseudomonadota bacterium]
MQHRHHSLLYVLGVLVVAACPEIVPGEVDAGSDAGPILDTVTVCVSHYHSDAAGELVQALAEGSQVAADLPGGARQELVADAQGLVEISGVDWSLGNLDLTVYRQGCTLRSYMGLDRDQIDAWEEDGIVAISVPCPDDNVSGTFVTLSGQATNMVDTAHYLMVSATTVGRSRTLARPGLCPCRRTHRSRWSRSSGAIQKTGA